MAGEIFISYRRADQDKARLLHALLKQRGVDAWYDGLLEAGADWRHKTAHALEAAPVFVLLFSRVASESDDISKELAAATFSKKMVIPVRIENIKPSGAFLYELASRNWFDAFENTEARFEILADQLAALVKGGPEAEVAAFNLGSNQPAPKIEPAAKPLLKRPVVLGGIVAAAVAAIAVAAFAFMPKGGPASATSDGERIAFFGYTAQGDDPFLQQIAAAVSDETFSNLATLRLDTAARSETQGVGSSDQIARTKDLGAAYQLGGEVRALGDNISISVHVVHAATRATIWQATLDGDREDVRSRAIQAAVRAPKILQCIGEIRPGLDDITQATLSLTAQACDSTYWTQYTGAGLDRWRALVRVAPRSAIALNALFFTIMQHSADPGQRQALLDEAYAISDRISALRPGPMGKDATHAIRMLADGARLAEIISFVDATIDARRRDGRAGKGDAAPLRAALYLAVGRPSMVAREVEAANEQDPFESLYAIVRDATLRASGEPLEAMRQVQLSATKTQDYVLWLNWIVGTVSADDAEFQRALAAAPAGASKDTIACLGQVHAHLKHGATLSRQARTSVCGAVGGTALGLYVELEDLDNAFGILERSLDRANPWGLTGGPVADLFDVGRDAHRADPRFLDLMRSYGQYQYWIDTGTHPEVCDRPEEHDFPVCAALRAEQGK